jgi:hypothetical protein
MDWSFFKSEISLSKESSLSSLDEVTIEESREDSLLIFMEATFSTLKFLASLRSSLPFNATFYKSNCFLSSLISFLFEDLCLMAISVLFVSVDSIVFYLFILH